MKKIPCLFKRDYTKSERPIINEVLEGSEWVINGEGIATKKYDGTCCLIENGKFYKRRTIKKGKEIPIDFIPATEIDEITGKQEGWVTVNKIDKYHMEAFNKQYYTLLNGTYELCGPKVQGNPENFQHHILIKHGYDILRNAPRNFNDLKKYFIIHNIEGIVWHHPNGRMVKIRGVDFGINRKEQFKIYGMSADFIIIDDPLNQELKSQNSRDKIWKLYGTI